MPFRLIAAIGKQGPGECSSDHEMHHSKTLLCRFGHRAQAAEPSGRRCGERVETTWRAAVTQAGGAAVCLAPSALLCERVAREIDHGVHQRGASRSMTRSYATRPVLATHAAKNPRPEPIANRAPRKLR
jgi:hypothetical protein